MMQKITTNEPDDKQLEVAIVAFKSVLDESRSGFCLLLDIMMTLYGKQKEIENKLNTVTNAWYMKPKLYYAMC